VNWLTRAGSLDRAATELATRGPALIHVGGRPAIERMLALFPVDHISSNPYLAFLRGQCNFQAFDFESLASAMADAVRGFRAVGNVELSFVAEFFLCFGQMNTGQLANVRDAADRLRANKPGGPAGALLGYLSAMLANAELRNDDVAPALSEMLDHLEAVPSHPIWDDLHFLAFFTSYPGAQCVLEKHDRAATRHIGNQATFLRVAVLHGRASRAFCQGRLQEAHSWLSSADEDLQWLGSPVSLVTENQQLHLAVDALLGIKESALQFAEKARADLSSSSKTNQRVHACSVLCGVIRTYWLLGEADSVRRIQRELQIAHNSWEWAGALVERALADGMVALLDGKPALAEKLLCADSVPRSWASFSIGAHAMVLGAEAQRLQGKLDAAAATLHRLLSDPATPSAFGGALVAGAPVLRNLANTVWGKRLSEVEQSELCRWAAIASGDTASEVAVEDGNALPAGLSAREAEVLALITKGQSNKLIARELGLSLFTVKRHVANILNKTSLGSRTELATWWLGLGRGH
jgi:LuxR family maltose regulon positive regulatory protein